MSPSPAPEELTLPGLRCRNCGRLAYDAGGGRACWRGDGDGAVVEHCGVMESVTLTVVVDTPGNLVSQEREAFDALLSLVVGKDRPEYDYMAHSKKVVAHLGKWRADGRSMTEARKALKDVIRAALIEQTGGTDAR